MCLKVCDEEMLHLWHRRNRAMESDIPETLRLRRDAWPPSHIRYARRTILKENVNFFAAHLVREGGVPVSRRSIESWEQGRRRPSLYIRLHLTRIMYRLIKQGVQIAMPTE